MGSKSSRPDSDKSTHSNHSSTAHGTKGDRDISIQLPIPMIASCHLSPQSILESTITTLTSCQWHVSLYHSIKSDDDLLNFVSIHLPAHSSGSGGSSNAAHHHHQDENRVGSATSNTVTDSVKAAQNLSTAVPATVAVAIPHQEENNQPPLSNHPTESHHAPAQGVVVLASLVEQSIAPVIAASPTADYSHYNSKLTIQDFDLLKVRFEH
jgi:hypothetical protein